ncbi:hypothetical protein BDP55DRAFT_634730 [Colletotrichum godetiae]|uniref:Uncharacterized protein n=1 Tax=Colletotrichum godetiae TaxID=1209918 RepID=A0AAJ0AJ86_9PEZI|nr:uncharacterized protein BDP55DRAFT_634730 [Colletotrichum godetiae]KAK1672721.1 hypothetical protein BDP55DRAFT_634730 [Colletotrichum godetiae]
MGPGHASQPQTSPANNKGVAAKSVAATCSEVSTPVCGVKGDGCGTSTSWSTTAAKENVQLSSSNNAGNQGQDPWLVPGSDDRSLVSTLIRPGRLARMGKYGGGISQLQCIKDFEVSGPLVAGGNKDIESFGVEPGRPCGSDIYLSLSVCVSVCLASTLTGWMDDMIVRPNRADHDSN